MALSFVTAVQILPNIKKKVNKYEIGSKTKPLARKKKKIWHNQIVN